MGNTRTAFVAKNSFFGIISKISSLILGFVSRTVFIHFLGTTYLGVNGLYAEILQMLSFAELGFGSALIFAMYKPVANNDEAQTKKLLAFYRTTYRIIALIITTLGIAVLPFLHLIVKGADNLTLFQLKLYFIIYLINTVANYFVSYKYSYVNALQKNYIVTNVDTIVHLITIVAQIVIMVVTKNFLAYLLTHTTLLLFSKIIIARYLNKKYPILAQKTTEKLGKEEKASIYKDVRGLALHQFSSIAIHSTDNIIISSFSGLGVVVVGLISNYNLIMSSILGFVAVFFNSVTASFGNIVASSSVENYRRSFLDLNFVNFWLYGFCAIAFFTLTPSFITLWLGPEFLIDPLCFLLIVINSYLVGQSTVYNNARIAKGNFSKDKHWALVQALTNLVVSIIGAIWLGLLGVYIGTIASRLVYVCFRPLSTYKFLFKRSCIEYYKKLSMYFGSVALAGAATYFATWFLLKEVTVMRFLGAIGMVTILPNVIFLVLHFRSKEFKNVCYRVKKFMKRENLS